MPTIPSSPSDTNAPYDHSRVTAIVVVHNSDPKRLDRCVSALRASTAIDLEIILVDNASTVPATHVSVDRTVRRTVNDGFAAGVNAGIRHTTAAFVAIINDDAVVAPDALAHCVTRLASSPAHIVAVAPKVLFARRSPDAEPFLDSCGVVVRPTGEAFSAGAGQPDLGQFDRDVTVLGPCMSAALFRRSAFDEIGLLDERYFLYYEDIDWALRAFLAGFDTAFVPEAIVHHEHAASTRSLGEARRQRLVARNLLLCVTANLSWPTVLRVWSRRTVLAGAALVKGPDRASPLRALCAALWHAPSALLVRHSRRALVVRTDAAAFAFADGLTPYVDVEHYQPATGATGDAARNDALRRRAASRLADDI